MLCYSSKNTQSFQAAFFFHNSVLKPSHPSLQHVVPQYGTEQATAGDPERPSVPWSTKCPGEVRAAPRTPAEESLPQAARAGGSRPAEGRLLGQTAAAAQHQAVPRAAQRPFPNTHTSSCIFSSLPLPPAPKSKHSGVAYWGLGVFCLHDV